MDQVAVKVVQESLLYLTFHTFTLSSEGHTLHIHLLCRYQILYYQRILKQYLCLLLSFQKLILLDYYYDPDNLLYRYHFPRPYSSSSSNYDTYLILLNTKYLYQPVSK
jgi:hypothetical protein